MKDSADFASAISYTYPPSYSTTVPPEYTVAPGYTPPPFTMPPGYSMPPTSTNVWNMTGNLAASLAGMSAALIMFVTVCVYIAHCLTCASCYVDRSRRREKKHRHMTPFRVSSRKAHTPALLFQGVQQETVADAAQLAQAATNKIEIVP
jgi:hypothetical protein